MRLERWCVGRRLDHQGPVGASEQLETNEGHIFEWPSYVEEVYVCVRNICIYRGCRKHVYTF